MPPRRPNFARFIATGAAIGALVGLVLSLRHEAATNYGVGANLGYATLGLAILGGIAAAVVAIVVDSRMNRPS